MKKNMYGMAPLFLFVITLSLFLTQCSSAARDSDTQDQQTEDVQEAQPEEPMSAAPEATEDFESVDNQQSEEPQAQEEEAPEPQPEESKVFVRTSFFIQFGAFKSFKRAKAYKRHLEAKNISTYLYKEGKVNDRLLYKVIYVKPYSDVQEVLRDADSFKQRNLEVFIKGRTFVSLPKY